MKISEIVVYPDRDENIEKYLQYIDLSRTRSAFGELTFSENIDNDDHYLALLNDSSLAAILHLSLRDANFWQITYSQTQEKYRGQGCFRYLLTQAVSVHGFVLSDDHHTPQAKQAWASLIQYPGPNLNIVVYDTVSGHKTPAQNIADTNIWNNKHNPILMISSSPVADTQARENVMTRLKDRTDIDRTDEGLWYGKNSSTTNYTNP